MLDHDEAAKLIRRLDRGVPKRPVAASIKRRRSRQGSRPNMRRARDPHDDPPTKRQPTRYRGPPVTLGHLRSHGCRRLLIYCSTGLCHHSAVVDADRWPDETAVRGPMPQSRLHQVRHDRRGRAAELAGPIGAREPDGRALALKIRSGPLTRGLGYSGDFPPVGRVRAKEEIAAPRVFDTVFRSKQWNGRIDPFHQKHVTDFACRRSGIMRGRLQHFIDRPAMGAGKIRGAIMLNLHTPLLQDQRASVKHDQPRRFVRKPE
jgi:hypothetical protein